MALETSSSADARKGFTLIETLLVLALVMVTLGITAPFYLSFARQNDLDIATQTVSNAFYYAQIRARSAEDDMDWSVRIEPGSATLYRGTDFAARDASKDVVYELANSVAPSGLLEVHLEKRTGLPSATGAITLTSTSQKTQTLTINEKGLVQIQ